MILGLHFGPHDSSAAIVKDGVVLATMEQERFDHIKHSGRFPDDAMNFCLDTAGMKLHEVSAVAYASDVDLTNRYKRAFVDAAYPGAFHPPLHEQSDLEEFLRSKISFEGRLLHCDHHHGHAASVFFTSPFDESAIFTVDGVGNWVTTTLAVGRGKSIETLERIGHPHSLGLFYGAVTQFLAFQALCDEGKTMGLAPYGRPTYADTFRSHVRYQDGRLDVDLSYYSFHEGPITDADGKPRQWYSSRFVDTFGPPRVAESEITTRDSDIAASAQLVLEERCYQLLDRLYRLTGLDNVCVAGGVALNCSMNGKIRCNTPFRNVFVMPAANDAGLSLGAALWGSSVIEPGFRRVALDHAYLGSEHGIEDMEAAFRTLPPDVVLEQAPDMIEAVADLLARFAIVGWFQGRMEFGPRALGHRSILANPTRADTKDIINARVKFREMFRPFAPVVPIEEAADYFEPGFSNPFMLQVVSVLPEKRSAIPAVTHVDGSARVQTLTAQQNPLLHRLLFAMKRRNGVPVLLNTSFNVRGDTIVRTPEDAVRCFLTTGMDALAIGPYLLRKRSGISAK
jgi:carbamoyltransferase